MRKMVLLNAAVVLAITVSAQAQEFPTKPIRIVTTTAGGGSDFVARIVAQGISGPLGQPVIVDNQATGLIGAQILAKAPPDGYTLYVGAGAIWILPLLQKAPYDMSDFAPVSLLERSYNLVAVHPSLPVKSVSELIALAKSKPGELNYASAGVTGNSHLATELFKSMAGVHIVHVPYKGPAAAITALVSGEVQVLINDLGLLAPQIKSGKLVGLAVTSAQPSNLFPGVPPVAATLPGYESGGMTGILAPAKTPAAVLNKLNQEIVRHFRKAEVREQFFKAGAEVVADSPDEFAAKIKADVGRMSKVIKEAGIRIQ